MSDELDDRGNALLQRKLDYMRKHGVSPEEHLASEQSVLAELEAIQAGDDDDSHDQGSPTPPPWPFPVPPQ